MYMRMMQAGPILPPAGLPQTHQPHLLEYGRSQQMMLPTSEGQFATPAANGFRWNAIPQRTATEISGSTGASLSQPPSRSATGLTSSSTEPQPFPYLSHVNSDPFAGQNQPFSNLSLQQNEQVQDSLGNPKSPNTSSKGIRQLFTSPKPFNPPLPQNDHEHFAPSFLHPASSHDSPDQQSLTTSISSTSSAGPSPELTSSPTLSGQQKQGANTNVKDKTPIKKSPPAEFRPRLNNKKRKPGPQRAATQSAVPTTSPDPASSWAARSRKLSFPLWPSNKGLKTHDGAFCKGASLMQTGNRGMKMSNQSTSMTGQAQYWRCSSSMCCFEGPALKARDSDGKIIWGFDDTIMDVFGVRYRWSFFAKSHVEMENSKGGHIYQCAFCSGQGKPCARVKGERAFIEHVSTHQAQRPDRFKMFLINYIVGRAALDEEIFDVNLAAPLEAYKPTEGKESDTGLGIHVHEWRDTIQSMDVDIMMCAEDGLDWQGNQVYSQLSTPVPFHESTQVAGNSSPALSRPVHNPTLVDDPPDLLPAPLFSDATRPRLQEHYQQNGQTFSSRPTYNEHLSSQNATITRNLPIRHSSINPTHMPRPHYTASDPTEVGFGDERKYQQSNLSKPPSAQKGSAYLNGNIYQAHESEVGQSQEKADDAHECHYDKAMSDLENDLYINNTKKFGLGLGHGQTAGGGNTDVDSRASQQQEQELEQEQEQEQDIHPAFRTHPSSRISLPNPWRTSYATLNSRHESIDSYVSG